MSDFEIRKRHLAGRAILLKESSATGEKILTVSTSEGPRTVRAKRVVVAAGLGRPFNPLRGEPSPRVRHASEIDIHQVPWASRKRVCIVGGGLTAATLAVGFSRKGYGVTLCTRGSISVGQLETDTRWAPGDEFEDNDFYDIFARTMSMKERARMIRTARVGHRITPRIWSRLIRQSELGNIDIREHSPHDRWEISADRRVHLPGILGTFDSLICATGYRQDVRELAFLKPMLRDIEVFEGLPVVKRFESSVKGLYFIGKLGELYGGPLSRNIPGARFAARMLADRFVRNSPY